MHELLGKLEGETRLGKTRDRSEYNIETGLKLTRSVAMSWLNFSQNTGTVMNLQNMGIFDWPRVYSIVKEECAPWT